MALLVKVDGGTGAGRKTLKQATEWTHVCPGTWDRYEYRGGGSGSVPHETLRDVTVTLTLYSCPGCDARRP